MSQTAPIFRGIVKSGIVRLNDPQAWKSLVARLEGAEIEMRLGKRRKARSLDQNAWYWSCIVGLLAEHCGYEPDEMHDAFRWRFLRKHDGPIETVRSTTELSTAEFSEYCEQCRRMAAEMGVVVPSPGDAELLGAIA